MEEATVETLQDQNTERIKAEEAQTKLTEAINQTDSLTAGRIVKDKQVVALMRYYELIKELRNVC